MLKKLLTISGIIPATFLAYLSIIGFVLVIPDLFGKWDWFKFLFCLSCILGLAGYFGLWVSFYPFTQDEYLVIVAQWLSSFGVDAKAIAAARPEALVWALERASRSGRVAWQFARDYAGRHAAAAP